MKFRSAQSVNTRRKHLKSQQHKMNSRRQQYFNLVVNQAANKENTEAVKEN